MEIFAASLLVFLVVLLGVSHRKVPINQVLIKSGAFAERGGQACFDKAIVFPLVNDAKVLDLQDIVVKKEMAEHDSCVCGDMVKMDVDLTVTFGFSKEDPAALVRLVGRCASDDLNAEISEFLDNCLTGSVRRAFQGLVFEDAKSDKVVVDKIEDQLQAIGLDSLGIMIRHICIEYLEPFPFEDYDLSDAKAMKGWAVLDAKIKKRKKERRERDEREKREEEDFKRRLEDLRFGSSLHTLAGEKQVEMETLEKESEVATARYLKKMQPAEAQHAMELAVIEAGHEQAMKKMSYKTQVERTRIGGEKEIAEAARILGEAICQKLEADSAAAVAEEEIATQRATAKAERDAQVLEIRDKKQVDLEAYRTTTSSQARLDSTILEHAASEKQSEIISRIGKAEAEVAGEKMEAGNLVENQQIVFEALREVLPLLPEIVEKAMIPAEQIDSIKILNVDGMNQANGPLDSNGGVNKLLSTLLGTSAVLPVAKQIFDHFGGDQFFKDAFGKNREVAEVSGETELSDDFSGDDLPPI